MKWKQIKDWPKYGVSDEGQVWNREKNRLIKHSKVHSGCVIVSLNKDGKTMSRTLYKIVAEAFMRKLKKNERIKHKDGDKTNNRVDNLEIVKCKTERVDIPPSPPNAKWRTLKRWPEYEVSDYGELRNRTTKKHAIARKVDNRVSYEIRVNGSPERIFINTLVAKVFINKMAIRIAYKDGDTDNNHVDNLKVTHTYKEIT